MHGIIRLVDNQKSKGAEALVYWHVQVIDPSLGLVESLLLTNRELQNIRDRVATHPEDCTPISACTRLLAKVWR